MYQDHYPLELGVHQKYAKHPVVLDLVWTHCYIINDIAQHLLHKTGNPFQLDPALIAQAALMHDVGVYFCDGFENICHTEPCNRLYAEHTIAGAWILQQEKFHPMVIQAAFTHAGVGLTPEDITQHGLKLPPADYTPQTPFLQFMAYVAKFHSKTPRLKTNDEIKASLGEHGSEKVAIYEQWEQAFGIPDISAFEKQYQQWHQSIQFSMQQLTTQQTPTSLQFNSAGLTHQS